MSLFTITLVLFLIMDPFGNISSSISLLRDLPIERQRIVLFREMLLALAVMLAFNFFGKFLFSALGISEVGADLSSGIILFLVAIKILFPSSDNLRSNLPRGEPFITPLAVPLIAGPSLGATIMLYANIEKCNSMMVSAILLAWLASGIILFFAQQLKRVLTQNGLLAIERLVAMVLVLIAVQRFMEGVLVFIKLPGKSS